MKKLLFIAGFLFTIALINSNAYTFTLYSTNGPNSWEPTVISSPPSGSVWVWEAKLEVEGDGYADFVVLNGNPEGNGSLNGNPSAGYIEKDCGPAAFLGNPLYPIELDIAVDGVYVPGHPEWHWGRSTVDVYRIF